MDEGRQRHAVGPARRDRGRPRRRLVLWRKWHDPPLPALAGRSSPFCSPPAAPTASRCAWRRPVLYAVQPAAVTAGTIDGPAATLRGWGFDPRATVRIGSRAAVVTRASPATIELLTPAQAQPGPAAVTVENPDGSRDVRE